MGEMRLHNERIGRMQHQLSKNGWTNWYAIWDGEWSGRQKLCIRLACTVAPPGKYGWMIVFSGYKWVIQPLVKLFLVNLADTDTDYYW